MEAALNLARRGLGRVWPNPAVGCVLVGQGGMVVGRGWTQPGGRPHAETEALARAGEAARGATAYVTLEPCSHHGQTPPCSDALAAAGIAHAVIAVEDPDERVSGKGMARLEGAGVNITSGVCETAARDLNAGFFLKTLRNRPLFTLKTATTLDGQIATTAGDSRWITGPVARAYGHGLRARHDGVMIGIGTALADSPRLTCRLPGVEDRSPIRIVLDSHLRLPLDSPLVKTAPEIGTWVICPQGADGQKKRALTDAGVTVIEAPNPGPPDPERVALEWVAAELARRGLTRVLVEGGGVLAGALLAAGLVDRLAWFRAPRIIGGDGRPVADAFGVENLAEAAEFVRTGLTRLGDDILETYRRKA